MAINIDKGTESTGETESIKLRKKNKKESKSLESRSHPTEVDEVLSKEYQESFTPPPFTFKELKDAVPPELFEKSAFKSFSLLIENLIPCCALAYFATYIDHYFPSSSGLICQITAWSLYWIFQTIYLGGLWVIGHECGHNGFSTSKTLNKIVGFILHTALLVPYFSWQISHHHHHLNAGNLTKDQFLMGNIVRKEDKNKSRWLHRLEEAWIESPIRPTILILGAALIGYPIYLIGNIGGRKYDHFTNHFLPSTPMFAPSQRHLVVISNIGLAFVWFILGYSAYVTSVWTVAKYYFIPYIFVNALLAFSTILHHSDVYLPHYSDESWTFIRGALSTVDRNNGQYLNHTWHHINDTHVVHHLFPQMPYYNAAKAKPYIKAKLGKYYIDDKTPLVKALWRIARDSNYIEEEGGIKFYKRKLHDE